MKRNSIRTRLLAAFFITGTVLLVSSAVLLALHSYMIGKYSQVVGTMSAEYQLSQSVSQLIDTYNELVLSNSTIVLANNQKVKGLTDKINLTIHELDKSVIDPQAKQSFLGLKNSIEGAITEVEAGLADVAQDKPTAFSHYQAAHRNYDFVQTNSTTFTFDQLKYINSIEGNLHATYTALEITGGSLMLLVVIGSLLYGLRTARKIVVPLDNLTSTATSIAGGNLDTTVDPRLVGRSDEIGSLASSFNTMVRRLRDNITELHTAKAGVEQKVADRTRELSETKVELTTSVARLHASIDSLVLGYLMTDEQDDIITINQAAKWILGPNKDGQTPDMNAKYDLPYLQKSLGEALNLTGQIKECRITHQPINIPEVEVGARFLHVFIAPIIMNAQEDAGAVVVVEDITEAKALQRSRDEFFSIASHELRTPLTAIMGNMSLMKDYFPKALKDPEVKEIVGDVHDAAKRLIELVNGFLDMSRLEQGRMEFKKEPMEMATLIRSVLKEYEVSGKTQGVALKFDPPKDTKFVALADTNRAKEAIINLIGNALKFTPKGSVTVSLGRQAGMIHVQVEDTGAGIPEELQHLLFRKFQQAAGSILTRDNTRGTGLGLYISRMMMVGMGGQINLEWTEVGKGTRFGLLFPGIKQEPK